MMSSHPSVTKAFPLKSPEAKSGMNTKHTEEASWSVAHHLALDNEISMSIDGMKLEPGTISLHNFWKFSKIP